MSGKSTTASTMPTSSPSTAATASAKPARCKACCRAEQGAGTRAGRGACNADAGARQEAGDERGRSSVSRPSVLNLKRHRSLCFPVLATMLGSHLRSCTAKPVIDEPLQMTTGDHGSLKSTCVKTRRAPACLSSLSTEHHRRLRCL